MLSQRDPQEEMKTRRQATHWIYRYKDDGISVAPSRSESEQECWEFAITALRPHWMTNDEEADKYMHKIGEVIPDDDL